MRYHLGWEDSRGRAAGEGSGKMLRPALCLLSCRAAGGRWERAVPAAAALELLHNFTLIHDDIEDASERRHGRRALWSVKGSALAINAGDGMFALAHLALQRLRRRGYPPGTVAEALRVVDETTLLLCEGQHLDLANSGRRAVSVSQYLAMAEGKTAALLASAAAMGGILGGAPPKTILSLRAYGRHLGLAFQIRDDVLGIWGRTGATGKPASDDLRSGKRTYPVVWAAQRSPPRERRELARLLESTGDGADRVRWARAALERLGAREASEQAARSYAAAAVRALSRAQLIERYREELESLARFAAERHR